ncbi:MAG: signal peptidase I [Planctomycetes bacterium]|nr:signal peptidase I [Planctomycetota bacterium]
MIRFFRYVLYLTIIGMLWWLFANFDFIRLERNDASVTGISGLRKLLVERSSAEEKFERGEVIVFAILDENDRRIYRASRVLAVPGDRVASKDGVYTVNGEKTSTKLSKNHSLEGILPQGRYLVINDYPHAEFADSLRLGWIPREVIIGRFLSELPF